MKQILLSTSFSEDAYCALFYASKLFEGKPFRFIILNSFEYPVYLLSSFTYKGEMEEGIRKLFKTSKAEYLMVEHKLFSDMGSAEYTFNIVATPQLLISAINELIITEKVDFVLKGSKGKTTLEKICIGSNSFNVIKKIKGAALLIIPVELEYKVLRKIAFATYFKRTYYNNYQA